jgi:hypothetical protein
VRRLLARVLRKAWRAGRAAEARLTGEGKPSGAGAGTVERPSAGEWSEIYSQPPIRVDRLDSPVARFVETVTRPGDTLLEAGCGLATISAELAIAGRKVVLCDFSRPILDRALAQFSLSGLAAPEIVEADIAKPLPLADASVDAVWSCGTLEHWTDEALVPILREMRRVSRRAVVSLVPNAQCVFYRFGKATAERRGRWPYGFELPRLSLADAFHRAGMTEVEESTVWSEWSPRFLGYYDADVASDVEAWWRELAADDPVRRTQGYLLATVGRWRSGA